MSNIKNTLKIIIFIFIFGIIYTCLTYSKKLQFVDEYNIAGLYGEKRNSLDMVYIGGSAAFVYYQPLTAYEKYGIASYDFASNSMQAELYKYMTEEIYKVQNPKVIVIDARAYQYRDYDQPPTEMAYRAAITAAPLNKNKIEFVNKYIPKLDESENRDINTYLFDLKKYHSSKELNSMRDAFQFMTGTYKNNNKGFLLLPNIEKQLKEELEPTEEEKVISKETNSILIDYLDYIKTLKDTKFLFIVSPYNESLDEKQTFNYVGRIIKENGFDFIDANDYNEEMGLDYDTDFYNYNHVSIFGSDKYTDFLSNILINEYDMPDRRKDKSYESWNELLPGWHQRYNNNLNEIKKVMEKTDYIFCEPKIKDKTK